MREFELEWEELSYAKHTTGRKTPDNRIALTKTCKADKFCNRLTIAQNLLEEAGFRDGDRVNVNKSKDGKMFRIVKHPAGLETLKAKNPNSTSLTITSKGLILHMGLRSDIIRSDDSVLFDAWVSDGCIILSWTPMRNERRTSWLKK